MLNDPIMEQVHSIRETIARENDYSIEKIAASIRVNEKKLESEGWTFVSEVNKTEKV